MKWLHENIITINVPLEALRRAHIFSQQVIATINYSDSNQTQLNKIRDDHFVSKIGEEAAKEVISAMPIFQSYPNGRMVGSIALPSKPA